MSRRLPRAEPIIGRIEALRMGSVLLSAFSLVCWIICFAAGRAQVAVTA